MLGFDGIYGVCIRNSCRWWLGFAKTYKVICMMSSPIYMGGNVAICNKLVLSLLTVYDHILILNKLI